MVSITMSIDLDVKLEPFIARGAFQQTWNINITVDVEGHVSSISPTCVLIGHVHVEG
jgi:hypothetical protein